MQSDQRRKRKQQQQRCFLKPNSSSSFYYCVRLCILLLFFFFFFFFNGFPSPSDLFRSVTSVIRTTPSLLSTKTSTTKDFSSALILEDRIVFPDHLLLLVSKQGNNPSLINRNEEFNCVYRAELLNSSNELGEGIKRIVFPVLSMDEYDGLRWIVRCPLPPANYSNAVVLQKNNRVVVVNQRVHIWENLVYAAALDGETAVVFVKGLNQRPGRVSDPAQFSCHFDWGNSNKSRKYALTTSAVTAAQEVVRCSLPINLQKFPSLANGIRVSISVTSQPVLRGRGRARAAIPHRPIPSVAKLSFSNVEERNENKNELCACTMLWNQAPALREWIMYHSWIGVERWFIYDNNSDDNIKEVVEELERENYNVSRQVWPWIKTQEAGFSHCAVRARKDCKWLAFMDVDEFFYFPLHSDHHQRKKMEHPGHQHSLHSVIANFSSKPIGEIRTVCHSFGPSGLSSPPSQGVTVGYTCRLQSPERHKSIVRLDALDDTLLNVVHHFHLKAGYRYFNLPQSTAIINHYKYQVWQAFRAKFYRRVATYVTDWQKNQNEGSKDRAPGLGTEAIEPPNWRLRFCEVWDTGLRDFIIANLADHASGALPWERPLH